MRIIGGTYKGRKLPELKEDGVRPTLDRVRENLFNIISARIKDSIFLDLFSGSGAVGLEALSRGAKEVVFCEKSPKIASHIRKSADLLKITPELLACDYKSALSRLSGRIFDIVYLDPPYNFEGKEVLSALCESNVLDRESMVIYEHLSEKAFKNLDEHYEITDERKYGIATLTFLRIKNE